jgi:tetratricopeptide (TPR) repeat protein
VRKKKKPTTDGPLIFKSKKAYVLAGIFVVVFGASLAVIYELARLYTHTNPTVDALQEAIKLDGQARVHFEVGEYGKAADLLDFSINTYRDRIQRDYEMNDTNQLLKDKTMFAENSQRAAECYALIARRAQAAGDSKLAQKNMKKALARYRAAMKFWMQYDYAVLRGTSAPDAVGDYEAVLKELGLNDELMKVQSWVAKNSK